MPPKPKKVLSGAIPYSARELRDEASERVFTGEHLSQVAFPLGGIGAGCFALGGRGELRDWEIFNRPGKGTNLQAFFALWARVQGEKPVCKVVQRQPLPPFAGHGGFTRECGMGLPAFEEVTFRGAYPFAELRFEDDDFPLRVELTAFSPYIPLNDEDSGLPLAFLLYRLGNAGKKTVSATLVGSLPNVVGTDGIHFEGEWVGGCVNEYLEGNGFAGIRMTSSRFAPEEERTGSMVIAAEGSGFTWQTAWKRYGWWDDYRHFWDDLADDGKLEPYGLTEPSPEGRAEMASLGVRVTLKPGESVQIPFVIAWHFPNRRNYWNRKPELNEPIFRNHYAIGFEDAWAVASYGLTELPRLERETEAFAEALHKSTLPAVVVEAASSQMSIVKSNTCLWLDDGRLHGFEGCGEHTGCCPMNCTHVWNYEQAVAYLFPALERTMRRTDFLDNLREDGWMGFRTNLPLGIVPPTVGPAADGQMGSILKLYREWLLSGDDDFLRELWEPAKRALDFVPKEWDLDGDGVMEGPQHNTYDIEFYGPNTMMGSFYLGALAAAVKMAEYLGDREAAKRYGALLERSAANLDDLCWGGDYYIQVVDPEAPHRYQYGTGCLTDQLLGQWFAEVVGLGKQLPPARVRRALRSIFRNNFRVGFSDHANVQRIYALNEEAGTLICTWPRGGKPEEALVYSDEVWTGIEYQFAAHLLYEGLIDEGLAVVKAIRDRHDGKKRNPYCEFECGDHYARAMASWSLILALSGYRYSAPEATLSFAPQVSERKFRSFFSTGSGWGTFEQRAAKAGLKMTLELSYGSLTLSRLGGTVPAGTKIRARKVSVKLGRESIDAEAETIDGRVFAVLEEPVILAAGDVLTLTFTG
jgi:non-lysosomal glucosylceramidase